MSNPIHEAYTEVKRAVVSNCKGLDTGIAILRLVERSMSFLSTECQLVPLISKVPGKSYVTYTNGRDIARPANQRLLITDWGLVAELWRKFETGGNGLSAEDFESMSYTMALAPCLAMEIFDRQNKKGPATYFECFIGHLFAKEIGVNPDRATRLPIDADENGHATEEVRMTMDFLFDLGPGRKKVHVPVKMSTRERVVQAWSHQRLLENAFGENSYTGIMVLFSETKLDIRKREVVEICVPEQWMAYQTLLSQMERIYYFDMPDRYRALSVRYPQRISIKEFGEFFAERDRVLP